MRDKREGASANSMNGQYISASNMYAQARWGGIAPRGCSCAAGFNARKLHASCLVASQQLSYYHKVLVMPHVGQ